MSNKTSKSSAQQQNMLIVGGIIIAAVVVAIVAIAISSNSSSSLGAETFAELTKSRTDDGAYVLGNPDAPVTIVEFADFNCPACQQYKPTINQVIEELVVTGDAKLEYRMLVTAGGPASEYAFKLIECANDLKEDSFWDGYEIMFDMAIKGQLTLDSASTFADRIGIDQGELINCSRDANQVNTDARLASSLGVSSTPTVLIRYGDGRPQPLPYGRTFDGIQRAVEEAQ